MLISQNFMRDKAKIKKSRPISRTHSIYAQNVGFALTFALKLFQTKTNLNKDSLYALNKGTWKTH